MSTRPTPSNSPATTISSNSNNSNFNQIRGRSLLSRAIVVRSFLLVLLVLVALANVQTVWLIVTAFSSTSLIFAGVGTFAMIGFWLLYMTLTDVKQASLTDAHIDEQLLNEWEQRINRASLSLIGIALLAQTLVQLFVAHDSSLTAGFLVLPVLAPALGLNRRVVIAIAVVVGIVMLVAYLTYNLLQGTAGEANGVVFRVTTWLVFYSAIAGCTITFTSRLAITFQYLEAQNLLTTGLLTDREKTNQVGVKLSRTLAGIAVQLEGAASQQASGSQEQVATVTQTTSSLEELGETASQIATNSNNVAGAMAELVEIVQGVQAASAQAQTLAGEGSRATGETNLSVQQGRMGIEQLGQRLLAVTALMRKVSQTVSVIKTIADQTHLLALNASIEAAGEVVMVEEALAGGITSNQSRRGERFGTIAQEIKNLADTSQDFVEEIRQVITEMQGGVGAAVLVAEEGKKAMAVASSRSTIAGTVIHRLAATVNNSTQQFLAVAQIADEVKIQLEEISIATGQQKTAISQIVMSMRQVAEVSRQSAGAVAQIAQTAKGVNTQVVELNQVLGTTREG